MATLLLALVLRLTAQIGLSPLHTQVKLTLDPHFAAGTVCVLWDSEDASAGSDCWTVENSHQRTWVKPLTLRTGVYVVWGTAVGQDDRGNQMQQATPAQRVEVY